jgi:hypothetical protein
MEIVKIDIDPQEVTIDRGTIASLMGVDASDIPETYRGLIETELDETANYSSIRGGFIVSENIAIRSREMIFEFENTQFMAGKEVVNNLAESEKLALFVCTAGEEVTRRSRNHMESGNMLEGYICDIIGSLLVERAMDFLQEKLGDRYMQEGMKITNRYSPGFCNWEVSEQKKLFGFFPEGFCGVKLSKSSLMIPVKSLSGVIGIGTRVKYNKYLCTVCKQKNCIYKNIRLGNEINKFGSPQ